ncbi:Zinc finger MYM-type protein 1, partial [Camponotus floridanus]
HNDGNFRALLRFRVQSGDEVLKEHLLNSAHNAMYTSPDIQNEFIQLIGAEIISQIVKRAIKSRFFTVLANETTDISRIEQFSLCIRYI